MTAAGAARTRDWSRWRPWLVAGLGLWLAVGVALVDRASRQGDVSDIELSPSHVVGYAALAVLLVHVAVTFFRGFRHGSGLAAFPEHYRGLAYGLVAALAWLVLDAVWRSVFGINGGVEGALAPPRLLIPLAVALVASGPLLDALAKRGAAERPSRPSLVAAGPAVLSLVVVGWSVSSVAFNPARDPWNDLASTASRDVSEIWTMSADGADQRRLLVASGDGSDFSLPAWSPDGSRIAYVTWRNATGLGSNAGPEDQTPSIWTMAADGTDRRVLVDAGPDWAWIPAWSPDGEWVLYTKSPIASVVGGGAGAGAQPLPAANAPPGQLGPPAAAPRSELWLVRPDGTDPHKASANSDASAGSWSPDGRQIVYVGIGADGSGDLHVASVGDVGLTDDRVLLDGPANDWSPAWSPRSGVIAFVSNRAGNDDIWLVNADGSGLRQLTTDAAGDWVPAWASDGSRIAFVSDRSGDTEVWSMAPDGTDARNLTNAPSRDDGRWSVGWNPDASALVYASAAYPPAGSSPLAHEDLAAAVSLLFAAMLGAVAVVLVTLGAPIGGFTVALGLLIALAAIASDQWRFVPLGLVFGAVVDAAVAPAPARWRTRLAAAALPAAGLLAIGLTLALSGVLAWTPTLLVGVVVAGALLGAAVGETARRVRVT
jgi:Tol biopolymer transport system component